ncbi:MAG: anti-sigma factor [Candidatus Acidiferrales bacterium]
MSCDQSQTRLHAYFDGELDAMGAAEFERHLESCPDCETRRTAEEKLRSALVGAQLYARAPETLRNRLQGALPTAAVPPYVRDPKPTASDSWRWLAIAASVILAVILGTHYMEKVNRYSQQQAMAAVIVDAHLRSLQPGHLEDVISTDQHTVKPWFDGRIDFAPPVRDFASDGFPLLGGRLDVIDSRTAAALVYGRRKHIVNVFVEKAQPGDAAEGAGELQGYHWIRWQQNGFTFTAVSDTAYADLDQLKQLFLAP